MREIYLGRPADGTPGIIPYKADRHLMLIGPNGSGKGTRLLVQNLIYGFERSMLVIDPKGELAALTIAYRRRKGDVVVLNPFGLLVEKRPDLQLQSTGFNPLQRLDPNSANFPDDATGLAEALVRIEGEDSHWAASAQELVAALIMHARRKLGPAGSLGDVRRMLTAATVRDPATKEPVSGFLYTISEMAFCDYAPLEAKAGRFVVESRETNSILSTATTQTRFLDSPVIAADLAKGGFDFAEMKRRVVTVYLILPADRLRTHSGWLRLMVDSALRALYTPPNRALPPVLFVLDEFAQLGHMAVIEDAMGIARGYGVQLFPILQDLNQLQSLYRDRWQSFVANAGALMAFTPRDAFTAQYLSNLAGQKTQWVRSMSSGTSSSPGGDGTSQNFSLKPEAAPKFRPEKLMAMAEGEALLFLQGVEQPIIIKAPYHWELPELAKHVGDNPYYERA